MHRSNHLVKSQKGVYWSFYIRGVLPFWLWGEDMFISTSFIVFAFSKQLVCIWWGTLNASHSQVSSLVLEDVLCRTDDAVLERILYTGRLNALLAFNFKKRQYLALPWKMIFRRREKEKKMLWNQEILQLKSTKSQKHVSQIP